MESRHIEVCLSPSLLNNFSLEDKIVVVIDLFRATSAMTVAIATGVKELIPVATVEEAKKYQYNGHILAVERKGMAVKGFDMGNSPIAMLNPELKDKQIVITTSNGTKALLKATGADQVVVGSFLNQDAILQYLIEQDKDVLFLCAGWKDRVNVEDSLVAGAMTQELMDHGFESVCDSALMARTLFASVKGDLKGFLKDSSHTKRLGHLDLGEDLALCLEKSRFDVVPVYRDGSIVAV